MALTYFCTKCVTELDPTEVAWCNKNLDAPPTCKLCENELADGS